MKPPSSVIILINITLLNLIGKSGSLRSTGVVFHHIAKGFDLSCIEILQIFNVVVVLGNR